MIFVMQRILYASLKDINALDSIPCAKLFVRFTGQKQFKQQSNYL